MPHLKKFSGLSLEKVFSTITTGQSKLSRSGKSCLETLVYSNTVRLQVSKIFYQLLVNAILALQSMSVCFKSKAEYCVPKQAVLLHAQCTRYLDDVVEGFNVVTLEPKVRAAPQ